MNDPNIIEYCKRCTNKNKKLSEEPCKKCVSSILNKNHTGDTPVNFKKRGK